MAGGQRAGAALDTLSRGTFGGGLKVKWILEECVCAFLGRTREEEDKGEEKEEKDEEKQEWMIEKVEGTVPARVKMTQGGRRGE